MIELVYSEAALTDLERLGDFLIASDSAAASLTIGVIFEALDILTHSPEIGRKVRAGNRELVISRGKTGYLALYRFLPTRQRVLVLALRHQREAGYKSM
ncbi:type II toxin-antitoxin system RelE/ParE family toxin [Rhodoferax sp.]|uniref:type II toxin-antitoxin system RelE/ParE family toxin n=1 Tax=Rhodoferax sp. TaxID=50421 RepID=UPI0027755BC9|nr:type II toxin-antitoxin system RelE/ParE family toxin [Rhodoferax sp.]